MTVPEYNEQRDARPCASCGRIGMSTEFNANNNGLLVVCTHCGSRRPWGSVLYLKQNERRRAARPPLPNGETLDSVWEQFGNRCVVCSTPKAVLIQLGIGRQVHHVVPYAQEGHRGPLVPICSHCHSVATERQRLCWFYQRTVMKLEPEEARPAPDVPDASERVSGMPF